MTKVDKRAEIVRAALELIAEHGFHGAPMAKIADRAGVGAGTIYRYFSSKDVLIAELYQELEDKVHPVIHEGYAPTMTIREKFVHLGQALLKFFIENPLDFRYLEQFHNSPYGVEKRHEKLFAESRKTDTYWVLFTEGIAQQKIKDLPLSIIYAHTFGPLVALARDHILGFITLDDELIKQSIEACWDGIRI